jgi:hypothetical protein
VAFSDAFSPSTKELPAPTPLPSLEDLNLGLRLPKQQMIEHKKLDRFLETGKKLNARFLQGKSSGLNLCLKLEFHNINLNG